MNTPADLERCQSFLDAQLRPGGIAATEARPTGLRAITFSRQSGCGAAEVAELVAAGLQAQLPATDVPWTIFDRNLIEQVLKDHDLPVRLARFLPENGRSEVQDVMDELFGLHPSSWTVVQHTAETILRLVQLGNAIIIGRGAHMITARLPGVFHVRLVAPPDERIENLCRQMNVTAPKAREFMKLEDQGRARYLRKYFEADLDNPLHYHLVINTGLFPCRAAADLILTAVRSRAGWEIPPR